MMGSIEMFVRCRALILVLSGVLLAGVACSRNDVVEEAYNSGYRTGYDEGYSDGYDDGYVDAEEVLSSEGSVTGAEGMPALAAQNDTG